MVVGSSLLTDAFVMPLAVFLTAAVCTSLLLFVVAVIADSRTAP